MNRYLWLFIIGLCFVIQKSAAQIVNDTIELSGVEIQADRLQLKSISRLDFRTIQSVPVPDLGLLLREVPGMNGIRKGGTAIDPVLRGFRFSQVNVLANQGIKIEGGCPNRMDPTLAHFEADDVEEISIIKGPYTLRYGPVLGGLIQLKTFQPEPLKSFGIHGSLHTSAGLNPAGFGQYARIFGGSEKIYFSLSGSYKNYGNYQDGRSDEVKSSFIKHHFTSGVGFKPARNQEILFSLSRYNGQDVRFPALPMDEIISQTSVYALRYYWERISDIIGYLDVNLHSGVVYHEMDNRFRPNYTTVVPPYTGIMQAVAKVDAMSSGARVETGFRIHDAILISGIDFQRTWKNGDRLVKMIMVMNGQETTSTNKTNLWKQSVVSNTGGFTEFTFHYQNYDIKASARIDFNHGASQDTLSLISNEITYFKNDHATQVNLSANAGLIKNFSNGNSVGFFLGRGVRSPDLTERYIKFLIVGYDNFDYLGYPQLKPEINYQADLNIVLNSSKAGKVLIDGFAALVDDYISGVIIPESVAQPRSMGAAGVKQFSNTGRAYLYGYELSWNSVSYSRLSFRASMAQTIGIHAKTTRNIIENGQITGVEEVRNDPLLEIPPFETRVQVQYSFLKERCKAAMDTRWVASQKNVSIAFNEKETPGFMLLNFSLFYHIKQNIRLSAGVNNVLDNYYYEHLNRRIVGSSVRMYEPGRNFYININIDF